jgi:hypothetical protein
MNALRRVRPGFAPSSQCNRDPRSHRRFKADSGAGHEYLIESKVHDGSRHNRARRSGGDVRVVSTTSKEQPPPQDQSNCGTRLV